MTFHKCLITAILLLSSPAALFAETYKSEHGFEIDYPSGWHLQTYMDIYKTLREAQRSGGNFFRITSYPANDAQAESVNLFSRDELRVEGWIFPGYNGTLAELITSTKNINRLENFTIDGKKAKKVWTDRTGASPDVDDQMLSIYFVDEGKKVIFTCYPTYSSKLRECDKIVGSFRFE